MTDAADSPVTGLYVPGDRPERFDKAVATGAELVILDLEDAVAPPRKEEARRAVVEWLSALGEEPGCAIQVRVNAGNSTDLLDLSAVTGFTGFEIRAPKIERPADVDPYAALGRPVTALIETALGVENAAAIAAHPAVTAIALGESDLSSDLGIRSDAVIDHIRLRLLVAARAAGLPAPMLSAFPAIRDLDSFRADTERGRALGWFGRVAIHPSQLPVIREVFAPTADELAWAAAVLSVLESGGVATLPSGEMVDPAMAGRARSIIRRAR